MLYSMKMNSLVDDPDDEYHKVWAMSGDSGFRAGEEIFIHLHGAQQKQQK